MQRHRHVPRVLLGTSILVSGVGALNRTSSRMSGTIHNFLAYNYHATRIKVGSFLMRCYVPPHFVMAANLFSLVAGHQCPAPFGG